MTAPSGALAPPPEPRGVATWVFVVSCVLSMLGLVPSLLFLCFNLRFRAVRLIKMSSPNLNVMISVGGLLSYLSLPLWGAEAFSNNAERLATAVCTTRTWLLPLSFTLVFGSLLVKSWRVRRIFESAPATKVIIRDGRLFCALGALLSIDVAVLAIWQLTDPLRSAGVTITKITHADASSAPETHSATYTSCSCDYTPIWWAVLLVYKTSLLLYASYLSWAIRAVSIPSMNDSIAIILSCLVTTFTGSASAAICAAFSHWPNVTSTVTMAAIWVVTTFTLCVVNIPKMHMWWCKTDEEMKNIHVTSPRSGAASNQSEAAAAQRELLRLVADNRTLRKSLSEKEVTITELQVTVSAVKDKLKALMCEDSRGDSGLDLSSSSDLHPDPDAGQDQLSSQSPGLPNGVAGSDEKKADAHEHKALSKLPWLRLRKHHSRGSLPSKARVRHRTRAGTSEAGGSEPRRGHHRRKSSSHRHHTPKHRSGSSNHSAPASTARMRDSISDIARHMNVMDSLANQLHSSLTLDVLSHVPSGSDHVTQTPLPYGGEYCCAHHTTTSRLHRHPVCGCYSETRVSYITGSIVDSYNMDNDSDTVSYVSNHLSSRRRSQDSKTHDVMETPRPDVVTSQQDLVPDFVGSRDTLLPRDHQVYTLGSDMYYPDSDPSSYSSRSDRSGKRSRRHRSRGNRRRSGQQQKQCESPEVNGKGPIPFDDSFV